METLFGRTLEVPEDFENESVYVFVLRDGGRGGAPAVGVMSQLRPGGPPALAGGRLISNAVITRQRTDKPLGAITAEMRKQTLEDAPNLKLVQEGPCTVAKGAGHQAEYAASVQDPPVQFVQWHVTTVREGFACTFYCTCEQGRWAADKPRFEALIAGWK